MHLWHLKVHCCIYKIIPLVPVMSQSNSVYVLPSSCVVSILILYFCLCLCLLSWLFHSRLLEHSWISYLSHMCHMPARLIFLCLVTWIIFYEEYKLWSSLLGSFPHSPVTLPVLKSRQLSHHHIIENSEPFFIS